MSNLFLVFVLAFCSCVPALAIRKLMSRRIQKLEQDLQHVCNTVVHMAEKDAKSHAGLKASLDGLEERIMELSVPSHNARLPLERRHQVWTLARRGMSPEDISKRLKAPVGETELILNLGKYSGTESFRPGMENKQVGQYA
jgi:hypothetical protein